MKVRVGRDPDGIRTDEVEIDALSNPRWSFFPGGRDVMLEDARLFAIVNCQLVPAIAHSGIHGPCPHPIKVCILANATDPTAYASLAKRAGTRPRGRTTPEERHIYHRCCLLKRMFRFALQQKYNPSPRDIYSFYRPKTHQELVEQCGVVVQELLTLSEAYFAAENGAPA